MRILSLYPRLNLQEIVIVQRLQEHQAILQVQLPLTPQPQAVHYENQHIQRFLRKQLLLQKIIKASQAIKWLYQIPRLRNSQIAFPQVHHILILPQSKAEKLQMLHQTIP